MRRFKLRVQWANDGVQTWLYPHMTGSGWKTRSLTADQLLSLATSAISSKTTECPNDLRQFLLEYFFSEEEETANGGYGIILSMEELDA